MTVYIYKLVESVDASMYSGESERHPHLLSGIYYYRSFWRIRLFISPFYIWLSIWTFCEKIFWYLYRNAWEKVDTSYLVFTSDQTDGHYTWFLTIYHWELLQWFTIRKKQQHSLFSKANLFFSFIWMHLISAIWSISTHYEKWT